MPEKIDSCVEKVKKQMLAKGMSESEASSAAYGICSKSTGWKKSGAHSWRKEPKKPKDDKDKKDKGGKGVEINESALFKIEKLLKSLF